MKKRITRFLLACLTVGLMGHVAPAGTVHAAEASPETATQNGETENVNTDATISYRTHVQNVGWQDYVKEGATSGTSGKSLRLEGINIKLDTELEGSIEYSVHVQNIGWQDVKKDNEMAGTSGRSLRLEAIRINLTGEVAKYYNVQYRVHCQDYGWMNWCVNGQMSGTSGESKRLEAIEIRLVKKDTVTSDATVAYKTHVQNIGWQSEKKNGEVSGTSGRSLRLEGIKIHLESMIPGEILYKTHIQNLGWEKSWTTGGSMSGTSGRSLRLEAIQIKLTGEIAEQYDVYYRVHSQNEGWLGWAKNGETAGTASMSYRLEAIEIRLVKKGAAAPGSTARAYVDPDVIKAEKEAAAAAEKAKQEEAAKKYEEEMQKALTQPMKTNDPKVDARVAEIIKACGITDNMTAMKKAELLYDWIIRNTSYDWRDRQYSLYGYGNTNVSYKSDYDYQIVNGSYPVLFDGIGTCMNYSYAYMVLTRAVGLNTYAVWGGLTSTGDDHTWVAMNVGGTYYYFDPQIEDDVKGVGGRDYFMMTEARIKAEGFIYNNRAGRDGGTLTNVVKRFNLFKTN